MHTILYVHMILFVRSSATILFPPNQESKREASPFLQSLPHGATEALPFQSIVVPCIGEAMFVQYEPVRIFITILGP